MSDTVSIPKAKVREILEKIGELREILKGGDSE